MNKTLLKHSTITDHLLHETDVIAGMEADTVHSLVQELKPALQRAEKELLSPRAEVIERLLRTAALD